MSDVQSVLDGASFDGALKVTEAGVKGMITLRGGLDVVAAFWLVSDTEARVVCFRSVGGYIFDWLCNVARAKTLPVRWQTGLFYSVLAR